jgi:N-acetylglucosamine kinase-like BadF-type ATPase
VADREGRVRGAGRAGDSNIYSTTSPEAAVAEIEAAVAQALEAAGADSTAVEVAVFSLSGADWQEDIDYLEAALAPSFPAAAVVVVNDAVGALWSGAPEGVGVSVVCGTGGCVAARAPDGRSWHSGWWAVHTGGWAMGEAALQAVYAAELGFGPTTSLTTRALEVFGCPSVEGVLYAFTRRGGRHPYDTSLLAPAILAEAQTGDDVARRIVIDEGAKLGGYARAGARVVGLAGRLYPLVILGGVLRGAGAELLTAAIVEAVPEGVPVMTRLEPVAGALLIALDTAGAAVDASLFHDRLLAADPYETS